MSNYWNTLSPIHETLTKDGRVGLKEGGNGKWMQKAIDPEHKGYCTPMTKKTCTPRRKALAKRFKPGGDLHKT